MTLTDPLRPEVAIIYSDSGTSKATGIDIVVANSSPPTDSLEQLSTLTSLKRYSVGATKYLHVENTIGFFKIDDNLVQFFDNYATIEASIDILTSLALGLK